MRFLIKFIAILLVLGALVFTAGTLLPEEHTVSRSIPFNHKAEDVWKVIVDYPAMTEWNHNTKTIKQLENSSEGNAVWRFEDTRGHYMVIEEVEKQAPEKLVSRVIDTDYPFGGEWIFELRETDNGAVLTITENGTISSPLYRVFARYFLGYDKGIKMYEEALEKKLNVLPTEENKAD